MTSRENFCNNINDTNDLEATVILGNDKTFDRSLLVNREDKIKKLKKLNNRDKLKTKNAIKEISWIAFPAILFYLAIFMQQTINLVFVGNTMDFKSKQDALDGIGISHLFINFSLLSIVVGIISGFETLGSNAYGAKKYYLLGLYYQRAQLIGFIVTVVLFIFNFFFAVKIIGLFGIDDGVLKYVEEYIPTMMFFTLFDIQFSLNFRYFNIIGKSHVNLIILSITLALHPLWCYILMVLLELGVKGAAFSLIISQMLTAFSGIGYLLYYKPLPESIFFYNKDSFKGWFEYLKIALPSAFLMCTEWWAYEIMSLIAIWISKLDYTVHILLSNMNGNFYTISIGFGIAANLLVGKSICEKSAKVVKKYAWVTYFYGISLMAFLCTLFYFLKSYILYIFLDDEEVLMKGKEVIPILCMLNLFDFTQTVLASVCRGLAKQLIASLVTFINFYITQTSMAIFFGHYLEWGVAGIWFASFISCVLCAITYFFLIMSFDFVSIQQETLERIQKDANILTEERTAIGSEEKKYDLKASEL